MAQTLVESEARFSAYVDELASVIGHADRVGPLRAYCTGLLTAPDRKSVEPMAAVTDPARVSAQHQSLLHFVGKAGWSDEQVLAKVREQVLPALESHGPIEAWILDDTGIPKKGQHSAGVSHQYCGQLGKQANCQVAVSLSLANHSGSLPVSYRLYLPKVWAEDAERRRKVGVPEDVQFMTKPAMALQQVTQALADGLPTGVVLMDAGYGHDSRLRDGLGALKLSYVAGILSKTQVWSPDGFDLSFPNAPESVSVKALALALPDDAWQEVTWREGVATPLTSRFARVRVSVALSKEKITTRRPTEWLLIEWPEGEKEPTKYWLSTLPEDILYERMVDLAKLRWRIERDYQELKQEIGLGHFEGRGWRGFHHHATLCIAAYGFLAAERAAIPPSGRGNRAHDRRVTSLPDDYRPRGAADPNRATHAELNRNSSKALRAGSHQNVAKMSMLPGDGKITSIRFKKDTKPSLMTQ